VKRSVGEHGSLRVKFAVEVAVRWSDMDAYGHVNHARTVTLLEEARTELLFNEMPRRGMGHIDGGIVVTKLSVEYLWPLVYDGEPVLVEAWVADVKAASFVLRYAMRGRLDPRVLTRAETTMVPYNLISTKPRRLSPVERDFLTLWTDEDAASA
jgi:acyl-CoA thioester hydrolase